MKSRHLRVLETRFDAGESVYLARELESIDRTLYETKYPDLRALDFVPVIGGVDPGAELYTWRLLDWQGMAKMLAGKANDLPEADATQSENYTPIRGFGAKYSYSVQDLRRIAQAARNGSSVQLDRERARAAKMMVDRKIDDVICFGEANAGGITGLLNNSNIPLVTPITGAWTGGVTTAAQMLADLQKLEKAVYTNSKGMMPADTLLLPLDQYAVVAQTPLGTNNDKTVLQFFLANALSIKTVEPWYKLALANAARNGPRAVAYRRDTMVVGALAPLLFETQPPQPVGMNFEVPCEARCGGTVVRYPFACAYMDSI